MNNLKIGDLVYFVPPVRERHDVAFKENDRYLRRNIPLNSKALIIEIDHPNQNIELLYNSKIIYSDTMKWRKETGE